MDEIFKLIALVVFGLSSIVFVVYSLLTIYALSSYGLSRAWSGAIAFAYTTAAVILLTWGSTIVIRL